MLGSDVLTVRVFAAVFGTLLAGAIGHELTHIVVARLLGARVRVVDYEFGVIPVLLEWEIPDSRSRLVDVAINLSPFLVAVTAASVYYVTSGVPAVTVENVLAGFGLLVYGQISGEDLAGVLPVEVGVRDWWWSLSRDERSVGLVFLLVAGGLATFQVSAWLPVPPRIGDVLAMLGIAVVVAGIGTMMATAGESRTAGV